MIQLSNDSIRIWQNFVKLLPFRNIQIEFLWLNAQFFSFRAIKGYSLQFEIVSKTKFMRKILGHRVDFKREVVLCSCGRLLRLFPARLVQGLIQLFCMVRGIAPCRTISILIYHLFHLIRRVAILSPFQNLYAVVVSSKVTLKIVLFLFY